jgi:hypothetical protein
MLLRLIVTVREQDGAWLNLDTGPSASVQVSGQDAKRPALTESFAEALSAVPLCSIPEAGIAH